MPAGNRAERLSSTAQPIPARTKTGRASANGPMPAPRMTTSSLSAVSRLNTNSTAIKAPIGRTMSRKTRQDQQRQIKEHLGRQAAIDDQVNQPQRLRQPYRGAERGRDKDHDAERLPQDIAVEDRHWRRIIGAAACRRHYFPAAGVRPAAPASPALLHRH